MELAPRPAAREHAIALERTLSRVRWFGIALGIYQIVGYQAGPGVAIPGWMRLVAGMLVAALAVINLVVAVVLHRNPSERTVRALGFAVFGADILCVWGLVFAFSFEPFSSTWVILTVLTLEGALRYRLAGSLVPVGLSVPVEIAREAYGRAAYGHGFYVTSITFRFGILAMIGYVAGAMASNLQRERRAAEQRAILLEALADREHAARVELNAFQQVILAGVSAEGVEPSLDTMLEHIASGLGYERIAVLLPDPDGSLRPIAMRGFALNAGSETLPPGRGIAGAVYVTGRSEIVADVSLDPRYHPADATTRSQASVAIRVGDETVGVIDVESTELDAFDETDVSRLERLGTQMALVIENARLLSRERATVERLRELDTMKTDFIAIASHELRTPLTSMHGVIKTLLRTDVEVPPDQVRELLSILERQSDRLTRLVEDLLIVSRIDAGHVSLRMEEVDLTSLTTELLHEIGAQGARVSVAMSPDLGTVITDAQRLSQIMRNLVENALKFSPSGTTVRISIHRDDARLVVEVSDDGPGIPESELPSIFDRFHQVGGSLRRRQDGFGLGLYITKRLTEALGGSIEVESMTGRGTTFRVRVPAPTSFASSGVTGIA